WWGHLDHLLFPFTFLLGVGEDCALECWPAAAALALCRGATLGLATRLELLCALEVLIDADGEVSHHRLVDAQAALELGDLGSGALDRQDDVDAVRVRCQ